MPKSGLFRRTDSMNNALYLGTKIRYNLVPRSSGFRQNQQQDPTPKFSAAVIDLLNLVLPAVSVDIEIYRYSVKTHKARQINVARDLQGYMCVYVRYDCTGMVPVDLARLYVGKNNQIRTFV